MKNILWNILNALICWVKDNEDGLMLILIIAMIPFLYAVGVVFLEWIGLM